LRRAFQRAAGLTDEELAISTRVKGWRHGNSRIGYPRHRDSGSERGACTSARAPAEATSQSGGLEVKKPEAKRLEAEKKKEVGAEVDLFRMSGATLLDESLAARRRRGATTENRLLLPCSSGGGHRGVSVGENLPVVCRKNPAGAALQIHSPKPPRKIPAAKEVKKTPAPNEAAKKPAKAPEPEFELEQDFRAVLDPEPLVPAYDQKPPETSQSASET